MFQRVLVANRGEIAVRVMRTLREMGIESVAVYSEADRDAAHVRAADQAVALGEARPSESYLNIDKIISAAKESRAQAIHPGYGFLSENPDFARRVAEANLIFIGPPPQVLSDLADKIEARALAQRAGVPIVPGTAKAETDPKKLKAEARRIGYPVLIKAAAGGGGKGMRVVSSPGPFSTCIREAIGEAEAAFGDGSIFLEKFLQRIRHVEFQILADTYGNTVHLFERECSIQRRYQKIIEEAPSPAIGDDQALREKMGQAAITVARAAGYINAGTVEFLLDQDKNFYFMEVNARLQVEHPLTEMLTGIDLVRSQIEIAAGQRLPFTQPEIQHQGHAIECRIYAEDPAHGFLPDPGRIILTRTPSGPGLRFDSGIFSGAEVPVHYDPILGKLIAHARTRPQAIQRMIRALRECVVLGVKTPSEFLIQVLASDPFQTGQTHTGFIDEYFKEWVPDTTQSHLAVVGYLMHQLREPAQTGGIATSIRRDDPERNSPWYRLGAWDLER